VALSFKPRRRRRTAEVRQSARTHLDPAPGRQVRNDMLRALLTAAETGLPLV